MEYLKEIVHYFRDIDTGIGLDLDPDSKTAIVSCGNKEIDELFATITNNVTFITLDTQPYRNLKEKYQGLTIKEGNVLSTNLEDKSIDFIVLDSGVINFDWKLLRNELKRISSSDGYCDVVIIDEGKPEIITEQFLEFLYAGSWFEVKEFGIVNDHVVKIYHNPIGFNQEELNVKEITEFMSTCEDYCNVIENFDSYTIKDFLYNVQKALVDYYSKGFDLPNCSGSEKYNLSGHDVYSDKVNFNRYFKVSLPQLQEFIGKHSQYWSNYNPFPDENDDKNPTWSSLALDLSDIYEDIKSNSIAFNSNNIYNQQQALWDFKFDWQGHTGDHWTFAVRAIHWKLQDLEYEE